MNAKIKELFEDGPLDPEWLDAATEDDIMRAVGNDSMNLATSYITWHKELLALLRDEPS